ncbi:MAG: RlmE family RNA methyltransferase [Polyangiaceae bacterium]
MARKHRGKRPYFDVDARTLAAKKAGYAARSVFKLEEIDRRVELFKQGDHVLDLGAAPGSWSAYAAKQIGQTGKLLAIDLEPLTQALPAWAHVVEGDIYELDETLEQFAPYDAVVSDMAPNTTGDKIIDQLRSFHLFSRALEISGKLVKPGGHFVGKIFMSGEFPEARERVRKLYGKVRTIRPAAVRAMSYEIFLVGLGRRES